MKRKNILIGLIATILLALVVSTQALFKVDETNYAVVLQFQEIVGIKTQPGLQFKLPFVQDVVRFDNRILTSDTPPQEYLTSDEKRIVVDQVTRWRIKEDSVRRFFLTNLNEIGGRSRLEPLVLSELRAAIANKPYDIMISAGRDQIMNDVRDAVQIRVDEAGLGMVVTDIRTKRADLPTAVEQSVYQRMESARKVEADRHRAEGQRKADKIRSDTDRNVSIMLACADRLSKEITGDGEAAAVKIFAKALEQDPGFYSFIRSLEAYSNALTEKDKLIISTDSNFFKLLSGGIAPSIKLAATVGEVEPLSTEDIQPLTKDNLEKLILQCIPETIQKTVA